MKFPCLHCHTGVNKQRISCITCGNISHIKCVENLSITKYEEFVSRNEEIPFRCKICSSSNNIEIPPNLQQSAFYQNKRPKRPPTLAAAATAAAVTPTTSTGRILKHSPADSIITIPAATAAAAVVTTPSSAAAAETTNTAERSIDNHDRSVSTENNVSSRRIIRPSLVTDERFNCLKKKGLHFVHLNARSLFHKVSELKLITKRYRIAILSITEIWLDHS